uniref:Uncharacterized protein n=1 Tax=Kalanchoe fedtschenkoi TaxID=63787 RepID=A0A7N0ZZB3_KALFE
MERYFGNAFKGDPEVPHTNSGQFRKWINSTTFLKKAMEKNQPYEFKWNQHSWKIRDSYYHNWPFYWP